MNVFKGAARVSLFALFVFLLPTPAIKIVTGFPSALLFS